MAVTILMKASHAAGTLGAMSGAKLHAKVCTLRGTEKILYEKLKASANASKFAISFRLSPFARRTCRFSGDSR
jgi:hypothetical protein